MKTQIRRNVFETNSSNEHSLTIIKESQFKDWKDGKLLARVKSEKECEECNGNFWSRMYTLEFMPAIDINEANKLLIQKLKDIHLQEQEDYKQRCLNHKPSGDDYEDNYLYHFDENNYNYWKNIYEHLDDKKILEEYFGYIHSGLWMTYEDFINEMKVDCYSMFEHYDPETDTHIIGKYFHS